MARVKVRGNRAPSGGFADIRKALRLQPVTVARAVASSASPALTSYAYGAYVGAQTVYDTPRRPWRTDERVPDLVRTGATLRDTKFRAIGTALWCVLGTPYAKYLIGKYTILPNGSAAIPVKWVRELNARSDAEMAKHNARPL